MPLLKFRDLYATPERVVQADQVVNIPDDDEAEYLVRSGTAAYVEEDPPADTDVDQDDDVAPLDGEDPAAADTDADWTGEDEEPSPPARSGSKRDWVAYAITQQMPADVAEAKTRDELADHFLGE